jgi:glutathione S-transferase
MALKLIIGNKNYSSWSLRPWLAMKVTEIPFEEHVVPLDTPEFKEAVSEISPAGKVPALADDGIKVWDSLAILEYLAERFPAAGLWPQDAAARAHARTICAEMHAGFQPLRQACPMNFWRPVRALELAPAVKANVTRIDAMWTDCRARFGAGGPFLFGKFSAADAMYAPVVSRFHTYAIEVGPETRTYMATVMALPAWREWSAAALREPWVIAYDEIDWPTVLRTEPA